MKKLILICLFNFCFILLNAATYYVAPSGGSDSNPGTITQPWATWQKAFDTAQAGDTVYFRNGTWYPLSYTDDRNTVVIHVPREVVGVYEGPIHGYSGTMGNPICFFNYPGETPILDCSLVDTVGHRFNTGLGFILSEYIHVKGLTVRNVYQPSSGELACGVGADACAHMIFSNMDVYNIGGRGMTYWGANGYFGISNDSVEYYNCDIHNCYDPLSQEPGNGADGWKGGNEPGGYFSFEGCRAWDCSDDGFDVSGNSYAEFNNCWSWGHGWEGNGLDGNGFKFGAISESFPNYMRKLTKCLAAFNHGSGYYELEYANYYRTNSRIYNNTSYKNGYGFTNSNNAPFPISPSIYRNNISYKSTELTPAGDPYNSCLLDATYTESNNTWKFNDPRPGSWPWFLEAIKVTDADFISVDSTGISGPRKADGSLPDINFLKLAPTSYLIDAGENVGLDYYNTAPDLGFAEYSPGPQIIANHSIVDDYEFIPQYYIDSVKKMWLSYAGESHSEAIRIGLELLEAENAKYAVSVVESGTPQAYTDSNLRASRATWGDVDYSSGWIYSYGEEDWYTSETAIARTKAGLDYYDVTGPEMSAFGFGWCWDPAETDMTDYIDATQQYIDYCVTNGYDTKVFFTTGPVDGVNASDQTGYNKYLAHETIRDSVNADTTRILFDYADILSYDSVDGEPNTTTYGQYTYPVITETNLIPTIESYHISEAGALNLAKAMWWMLARMAGWDGNVAVYSEPQIDSTLTDIITFTLPTQTGAATINATNHTVAIEVNYLATITNLTPYIAVSYGATISPESMTSWDFTTPQTYTVTALDGTTTQEWVVTVTQAEEPAAPAGSSRIVKYRGLIFKL